MFGRKPRKSLDKILSPYTVRKPADLTGCIVADHVCPSWDMP